MNELYNAMLSGYYNVDIMTLAFIIIFVGLLAWMDRSANHDNKAD